MPYRDLREWIATLDKLGEIQHINEEVDWNLEVGAIIRRSYDLKAPAPLFENLKGYSKSYRLFGGPLGTSRNPN